MSYFNFNLYNIIWLYIQGDEERSLRFLFPLCGKSLDLIWVYRKGHAVIGIEAVASVVECLFKESNINFEKCYHEGIDGWVYQVWLAEKT